MCETDGVWIQHTRGHYGVWEFHTLSYHSPLRRPVEDDDWPTPLSSAVCSNAWTLDCTVEKDGLEPSVHSVTSLTFSSTSKFVVLGSPLVLVLNRSLVVAAALYLPVVLRKIVGAVRTVHAKQAQWWVSTTHVTRATATSRRNTALAGESILDAGS